MFVIGIHLAACNTNIVSLHWSRHVKEMAAKMKSVFSQNKKIVIFSHYSTTGACEELRDWLQERKVRDVVYVSFPFGSTQDHHIRVTHYRQGVFNQQKTSFFCFKTPEPLAYVKDLLYAILYGLRFARHADLAVGGDNLLSLALLIIRKIARIRTIVYYMIDYTPRRYGNPLLNEMYYFVDRLAATHADIVWPLTSAMIQGRFKAGRLSEEKVHWHVVPYGSHPVGIDAIRSHDRKRIVYMGDVVRNKGAELFVPMAIELKRIIPGFRLTIIGGGRDLPALREAVRSAGLEDQVELLGFIKEFKDVVDHLTGAGVAIAPYYPEDPNNFTFYADPGKIKVYLGCGLPIVLTEVPPIAKEIENHDAGKLARYDAVDFARAIVCIIERRDYEAIRERAWQLGAACSWPKVLGEAFNALP